MKATPYIQAIEDCIVLLNEIESGTSWTDPIRDKINNMLARLNDLKIEYYFQKDNKIDLEKPSE